MTIKEATFQGANWEDYSEVEFAWLDDTLRGGGLPREDMQTLADKFGLRLRTRSAEEIGDILINDIPKKKLLPAVTEIVARYPYLYARDEYIRLFQSLVALPPVLLLKLFLRIGDKRLSSVVKTTPSEFKPRDIARFILKLHKDTSK